MNEENKQSSIVKSSNLGFMIGVLVVVTIVMLVYKSSFVQNRLGKESNADSTSEVAGGFEILDEPEITLLDEFEILKEDDQVEESMLVAEEVVLDEVVDTHQPVDTAIGDINPMMLIAFLFVGAYGMQKASKKINRI